MLGSGDKLLPLATELRTVLGDDSIGEVALAEGDDLSVLTPSQSAIAEFTWFVSSDAEFTWSEGEPASNFGWS
jgi:hypothetical protein